MTVDILFLVKPLVVDTPKLKLIVRVEHVKEDNQVRVLAPVLIHHLLPQASIQKYQIINPRARVRSTVERPEVKTVKTKVDLMYPGAFCLKPWQPTKYLKLRTMSKGTNLMMN